ncbi:MAG: Stk1 family PASTA domain-containing Ser/Thr kinase [Clostridiales bacterium]|nr:Stk1 family PASTA domain-containing Ser/Thr kinase [Clostridiales bacterium]
MIQTGMIIAGRYEVQGLIGAGGMANVYKAVDHTLGRTVAIKVLKDEYSTDSAFVDKFKAEAHAAAGLEHPNIVNVYDVGCHEGCYYIIMEYVQGITLKSYIEKKGKLNYRETLSIAIQVSRGIQAAHAKGIIHRDIKPQNIIISTDGKVKVTDFGIARAASENTIHSDVMGSVHYASPEQARNGYVSTRSDIYSLGIVMYEMVTGRVPFDGESSVEVAIKHLQDEMVAPSTYAPDLPISLEKIILKCTQKSPDRRYESMDSLLNDLRRSLQTPYEDFVVISAMNDGKTRVISEEESREIQERAVATGYGQNVDDDDEDKKDKKYAYIYDDDDDEDDEDEGGFFNKRMEKVVSILRIVVLIIIILIVVYIIGSWFGLINFGFLKNKFGNSDEQVEQESGTNEMISLLGMTLTEAQNAVDYMGITVVQSGTEASDEYAVGQIISQDIAEGDMVTEGTVVNVVVAAEAEAAEVTVPDVVGYTSDSAMTSLQDMGFNVYREFQYSSTIATGQVISQSPAAGSTAHEGDTITIYVSQGTESTVVPDVRGKTENDARTALANASLNTGTVTQDYSDSVAEGSVISQSVAANSTVSEGTSVDLVVSKGKKITTYYINSSISAPDNVDLQYANITLYLSESDEVLGTWSNVTTFPYTINVTGITGGTAGTLIIDWYYTDSAGDTQVSEQEASVTFKQEQ